MSRSSTQTPLQKELERFDKLTATEKADVQINIWNRTKTEVVADLEKFKHEGDTFFARATCRGLEQGNRRRSEGDAQSNVPVAFPD